MDKIKYMFGTLPPSYNKKPKFHEDSRELYSTNIKILQTTEPVEIAGGLGFPEKKYLVSALTQFLPFLETHVPEKYSAFRDFVKKEYTYYDSYQDHAVNKALIDFLTILSGSSQEIREVYVGENEVDPRIMTVDSIDGQEGVTHQLIIDHEYLQKSPYDLEYWDGTRKLLQSANIITGLSAIVFELYFENPFLHLSDMKGLLGYLKSIIKEKSTFASETAEDISAELRSFNLGNREIDLQYDLCISLLNIGRHPGDFPLQLTVYPGIDIKGYKNSYDVANLRPGQYSENSYSTNRAVLEIAPHPYDYGTFAMLYDREVLSDTRRLARVLGENLVSSKKK